MDHSRWVVVISALCAAGASACVAEPGEAELEDVSGNGSELSLATRTSSSTPLCVEPREVTEDPEDLLLPPPPAPLGEFASAEGLRTRFEPRRRVDSLVRRIRLADSAGRTTRLRDTATQRLAGWTVVVQPGPVRRREARDRIFLTTGGRALSDVELLVTYDFRTARDGSRELSVGGLTVQPTEGGTAIDRYDPSPWFADPPSDCREEAIVQFGRFPWGMPPVNVPPIVDCSADRCRQLTTAWLKTHMNVWRATQMIAVLDPMHPEQRKFFWKQPGTDEGGEAVSLRSSPAHWFGSYDADRYEAIREVVLEYHDNMLDAQIGNTDLRLRCPDPDHLINNLCFVVDTIAHHLKKGTIDFCEGTFGGKTGCDGNTSTTIDEAMHHEPLHHVWTHLNGVNLRLKDVFAHQHGSYCGVPLGLDMFICEDGNGGNSIRHLATWEDGDTGNTCNHRSKVVRAVDAYALFIRTIGEMVLDGTMTHWPKLADPTPTPPDCVGEVGCLCEDIGVHGAPDGDYLPTKHCPDHDGLAVCTTTKFNASDTVGICTRCSEHRGPGCPCNDLTLPCDQGFCFGDDTRGVDSATGTCYEDPPPSWGCLADCEELIGAGAFCMHDHPAGGRCVPVGTTLPEASECWVPSDPADPGGHMDWNELECTFVEQCITTQDCHDLGYPSYYTCDASLRCVPDV